MMINQSDMNFNLTDVSYLQLSIKNINSKFWFAKKMLILYLSLNLLTIYNIPYMKSMLRLNRNDVPINLC